MFQIIECHASYGPYAPLGALWDSVRHPVRHPRHANAVTIMQEYVDYASIFGILDFEMSELLLSRIFFGSCFRKLNAMHRRVCTTGLHVINKVYGHWIPMNKNSIAPCSFCMSRVVF